MRARGLAAQGIVDLSIRRTSSGCGRNGPAVEPQMKIRLTGALQRDDVHEISRETAKTLCHPTMNSWQPLSNIANSLIFHQSHIPLPLFHAQPNIAVMSKIIANNGRKFIAGGAIVGKPPGFVLCVFHRLNSISRNIFRLGHCRPRQSVQDSWRREH